MNEIRGGQWLNLTQSGLVVEGTGKICGFNVNSHTSGVIRFLNGRKATLATRATQTLTSDATNVSDGDTVTIGSITYRFKTTPAQAYDVKIGASAAATLDNLKAAINASGTDGTEYYAGTYAHPDVIATTNTNTTQVIQAVSAKAAIGNVIATTETSSHLSWGAATMSGGVDGSDAMGGTIALPTGPGFYTFAEPMIFDTGLYFVLSSGSADITPIFKHL